MSTLALKYRPARFSDFTGQKLPVETLRRSAKEKNIFHSIILCGSRGTGKTSCARVYAKALNCENLGEEGEPCCECVSCKAIPKGSSVDVMEVDAASQRGIDSMRKLKQLMAYAPTEGEYRVAIMDEAHSLTNESWQSLLKVLEEPPQHAIFIFATTAPEAIPETIWSRSLVLPFARLQPQEIDSRLRYICEQEKIKYEEEALREIARRTNGGLRDAVKLVDQIVVARSEVTQQALSDLLVTIDVTVGLSLLNHLVNSDHEQASEYVKHVVSTYPNIRGYMNLLIELLLALGLVKMGASLDGRYSPQARAELLRISELIGFEDLWRWRDIAQIEAKNLSLFSDSSQALIGFVLRSLTDTHFARTTTTSSAVAQPTAFVVASDSSEAHLEVAQEAESEGLADFIMNEFKAK